MSQNKNSENDRDLGFKGKNNIKKPKKLREVYDDLESQESLDEYLYGRETGGLDDQISEFSDEIDNN